MMAQRVMVSFMDMSRLSALKLMWPTSVPLLRGLLNTRGQASGAPAFRWKTWFSREPEQANHFPSGLNAG